MQNKERDKTKFMAFICKVAYVGTEQNDRQERIDTILTQLTQKAAKYLILVQKPSLFWNDESNYESNSSIIMALTILQWNSRSLIAYGQEKAFK